jgi:hypothetical protein
MKMVATLLVSVSFLLPVDASACSYIARKPDEVMSLEENLVIAYPAAISNRPKAASNPQYREEFRQTILWTVVISFKGRYKPGDQFTTRETLNRSNMCTPGAGLYTKAPLLLGFSGREPYRSFREYSVEHDVEEFMYLQKKRVRSGT